MCGAYIGYVERISPEAHFVIHDFWANPISDKPPVAADDAAAVDWFPLYELDEVDLVDGMYEFFAEHGIVRAII